jgi:hypothetical protein
MAILDPLPYALAQTLSRYPRLGERNLWLFEVAARARHVATPQQVAAFLQAVALNQGWTDRDFRKEIMRAVQRAFAATAGASSTIPRASCSSQVAYPPWPTLDPQIQAKHIQADLLFDPGVPLDVETSLIIDAFYQTDALLCLANKYEDAKTAPRDDWRGRESDFQYVVPNTMTALIGINQDGNTSTRCLGNATTNRIYQVIEFDEGSLDEHAAILSSLHCGRAPLILVVWSGSKSLHGWFDVRQLSTAGKRELFAEACRAGADRSLWDPCKLVRMPGGIRRNNSQKQAVLFFNPRHPIIYPTLPDSFNNSPS